MTSLKVPKDEDAVKDGLVPLSCQSKSKRRRVRKKNRLAASILNSDRDKAIFSSAVDCYNCIAEQHSVDAFIGFKRLKVPTVENNCVVECDKALLINSKKDSISTVMNTNKDSLDRNDVQLKRQEKKQAKVAAKLKSKNKKEDNQAISVNEQKGKYNNDKLLDNLSLSTDIATNVNSTPVEANNVTPVLLKEDALNKSKETDKVVIESEANMSKMNDGLRKTEKTREEILAEREAKKQAKLNAKLKAKFNQAEKSETPVSDKQPKCPAIPVSVTKMEENVENTREEVPSGKSKAELKAERRAKQEAQRAAKEAEKRLKLKQNENQIKPIEKKVEIVENKTQKEKLIVTPLKVNHQRVKLFSHLKFDQKTHEAKLIHNIHPEIVQLGIKYSSRIVMGSNARCVALLKALKEVIMDYITPSEKEFSRGLESHLSIAMAYLNKCRPSSVSMINALRHIKSHLTQLPNDITDVEARRKLRDVIDTYIREQIDVAGEAICNAVQKKIANGDNILIYACSSLLYRILLESHKSGKQFTVVVVDSGPWFEGREMLRRLVENGIKCSYVLVSALSFIMREVTKVLLGAHALLANGSVMSRTGSALVALVASSYNVPVLVCCETYKFCERVQMDAFVYNELGNDDDMAYARGEVTKENDSTVATLSVLYDITPADLVTAVITELAILPCTSVPVILRIRPSDVVS